LGRGAISRIGQVIHSSAARHSGNAYHLGEFIFRYNQTVVRFICTIDWLQNDNLFLVYVSSYTPVVIGVPLITGLIAYLILYVRIKQGTHTVEWATPGLEGLVRSIMHLSTIHGN